MEALALVVESNLYEPFEDRDCREFRWDVWVVWVGALSCQGQGRQAQSCCALLPAGRERCRATLTAVRPPHRPCPRPVSALEWRDEDGGTLPAFVADALRE